jgi:hypothetical protein
MSGLAFRKLILSRKACGGSGAALIWADSIVCCSHIIVDDGGEWFQGRQRGCRCRLPISQELLRGDIIIPMEEGADSQPSAPIERGLPSGPQPGGAAPFLRPTSQNSFQVALPPPTLAERSHRGLRGSGRVASWAVQGSGAQEPRVPEAPRP